MTRFHCVVNIFNPFFEKKLDNKGKINSVWFYDYDLFFDKILQDMTWEEIRKFKLNVFEWYKSSLSVVCVSEIINGDCLNGYSIPSCQINVGNDVIARCLSSRKIRDRYFDFDCLREKYFMKPDFISFLRS